jgi:hypothetical protein
MTNSNLFQKIQIFPKKPKLAKKAKIGQKSIILDNFGKFVFFCIFLHFFGLFLKILAFLANFSIFLAFFEIFGFHVANIRAQKSDVDDSVEGTEKAM